MTNATDLLDKLNDWMDEQRKAGASDDDIASALEMALDLMNDSDD